jgi:uncharacterized protein YdiU (UPF0061 family)
MEAVRAAEEKEEEQEEEGLGQEKQGHGLPPLEQYLKELEVISSTHFADYFTTAYDEVKRRKMGFETFDSNAEGDLEMWNDLEKLMYKSQADFTILFRNLGMVAQGFAEEGEKASASASTSTAAVSASTSSTTAASSASLESLEAALAVLTEAFYDDVKLDDEEDDAWLAWLSRYRDRIQTPAAGTPLTPQARRALQDGANPKYVLRNWMAVLAYERAEKGDYSQVHQLTTLLERPYVEQEGGEMWFGKTPSWATNMPGVAFLS